MITERLCGLLRALAARNYAFVTPTPSTCRRMFERAAPAQLSLRDIFGWSRAFTEDAIDAELLAVARAACVLAESDGRLRSTVRVSTVHGRLFLHSAFPADESDAVFLGPDSYRFADFIALELASWGAVGSALEVGAGAGVGGLVAAQYTAPRSVTLTDVNPKALRLAAANAAHAGVPVTLREASGLDGASGELDLIVANPPYMAGEAGHIYKDGGAQHGAQVSLEWARAGMDRLAPGGRLLLYTGSAILDGGVDDVRRELEKMTADGGFALTYRELDPDVFNEELQRPAYADAERIAAVGAVITRTA